MYVYSEMENLHFQTGLTVVYNSVKRSREPGLNEVFTSYLNI